MDNLLRSYEGDPSNDRTAEQVQPNWALARQRRLKGAKMKLKLYGDNEVELKDRATKLCLREGWRLAKLGSSWMGSGVKVAVLKKRR